MDNLSAGNNCPVINNRSYDNCLYADILGTIDLGIVILNIKRQEVIFKNKFYSIKSSLSIKLKTRNKS